MAVLRYQVDPVSTTRKQVPLLSVRELDATESVELRYIETVMPKIGASVESSVTTALTMARVESFTSEIARFVVAFATVQNVGDVAPGSG